MNEDDILNVMFSHIIEIKMYHFQTRKAAAHKAVDAYLTTFLDNFDKFMEVYQGGNGTVETTSIDIQVQMSTDQSIEKDLNSMLRVLGEYDLSAELDNLRLDMIAEIQKLKYLLTFQ